MDIGSSYIASDLLAAVVLLAQLEAMEEITALRRRVYDRYSVGLAPLVRAGTVGVQSIPQHCASNFHMFYILVEDLPTRTRSIEHLETRRHSRGISLRAAAHIAGRRIDGVSRGHAPGHRILRRSHRAAAALCRCLRDDEADRHHRGACGVSSVTDAMPEQTAAMGAATGGGTR